MILPLSESQLRTYLDTGKVEAEIPEPRTPPCQIADDGTGRWTPVGIPWAGFDWWPPVRVGDRVAIGEEWRMPRWDDDHGVGIYYRDEEFRWHRPSFHVEFAREYLSREWYAADTMPEWAARHHATVATIAFERRGGRWAWIVGLEADSAD